VSRTGYVFYAKVSVDGNRAWAVAYRRAAGDADARVGKRAPAEDAMGAVRYEVTTVVVVPRVVDRVAGRERGAEDAGCRGGARDEGGRGGDGRVGDGRRGQADA
jgi:hypothetical protein